MSQQHALGDQHGHQYIGGTVPSALQFLASPQVLGAVLGMITYKGHRTIKEYAKKGYKDGVGSGEQGI